jgi:hypothetical protein
MLSNDVCIGATRDRVDLILAINSGVHQSWQAPKTPIASHSDTDASAVGWYASLSSLLANTAPPIVWTCYNARYYHIYKQPMGVRH